MKDVERTFQERPLFLLEEVQKMMTSILFTWSKENSEISYKQGMNEILGILLFVAYAERALEPLDISDQAAQYLRVLNSPEDMEADIYWMFKRVMELGQADLFNPVVNHQRRRVTKKEELFSWDQEREKNDLVNQDKSNQEGISAILKRCHRIHHRILQTVDKELYNHLEKNQIEPQMYLQRWLRCMLSREFNLADTFTIWDGVFALIGTVRENKSEKTVGKLKFDEELVMLDFVCVSMIIFVREFCKFLFSVAKRLHWNP